MWRIEGIIIYRAQAIVLIDGCIVELRAFVTGNGGEEHNALACSLALLPVSSSLLHHPAERASPTDFHSTPSNPLLPTLCSLRANRFDSCLANESTFPPNRQNKSSPSYNVDDFVTMRVCSASTYARINTQPLPSDAARTPYQPDDRPAFIVSLRRIS